MQYRKLTKAQQGRGWAHDKTRARLIHSHTDGTPCWWCGKPMYKDPKLNWDQRALHADHSRALGQYGAHNNLADRLLHATCNQQRGDGTRDHQRPTNKPTPPPFTW